MEPSIRNILHLPLELFRAILAQVMLVRGIRRALRLRLVNRVCRLDLIRKAIVDACRRLLRCRSASAYH